MNECRSIPFAFTELGVSMLSSVLTSEIAIQANARIMHAVASMCCFIVSNAQLSQRLENLEYKQIAMDYKEEKLYEKLADGKLEPRQGVFFEGQVFEAYTFVCGLIKQATKEVPLFANHVDEAVLTLLDKRGTDVSATIYSKQLYQ